MKFAVYLLAVISVAYGGYVAPAAVVAPAVGIVNTGSSAQFRSQDNLGNYAFGYNEDHSTGGTFRRESGSPGVQVGSYGLRDIDGRVRVVNYVADGLGFRAQIQTNEPGVEPKDPASVLINKAAAIVGPSLVAAAPAAPVAAYAAPAYAAPAAYAAPVAYAGPAAYAAPAVAPAYAAPAPYAAPVAVAAPITASSYSTVTQHAAPAAIAAPIAAYAAPAPLAAPVAAYAAPAPVFATKTIAAAPIVQQYATGWKK